MYDGDCAHLADHVKNCVDGWAVKTRRPAGDFFGEFLFLEVDLAKTAPDARIQMDHLLYIFTGVSVLQIEGIHHWIHSCSFFFRQS